MLGIFARVAAKLLMVDLQVRHRSTQLTAPSVAPQDLLPQGVIGQGIESQRRPVWTRRRQISSSLRLFRNICF